MAHYAFLNSENKVIEVITGKDENDLDLLPNNFTSWEEFYLTKRPNATDCKRTSYNTVRNEHTDGGTAFRGNYAGIGHTYDPINDVFIPNKPQEDAILDENTWDWIIPSE